jgi:hypothetical protein
MLKMLIPLRESKNNITFAVGLQYRLVWTAMRRMNKIVGLKFGFLNIYLYICIKIQWLCGAEVDTVDFD